MHEAAFAWAFLSNYHFLLFGTDLAQDGAPFMRYLIFMLSHSHMEVSLKSTMPHMYHLISPIY
jgi:hypothetical protein